MRYARSELDSSWPPLRDQVAFARFYAKVSDIGNLRPSPKLRTPCHDVWVYYFCSQGVESCTHESGGSFCSEWIMNCPPQEGFTCLQAAPCDPSLEGPKSPIPKLTRKPDSICVPPRGACAPRGVPLRAARRAPGARAPPPWRQDAPAGGRANAQAYMRVWGGRGSGNPATCACMHACTANMQRILGIASFVCLCHVDAHSAAVSRSKFRSRHRPRRHRFSA
jgi:hypothetical protein